MISKALKTSWQLFKKTVIEFFQEKSFFYGAALSFYTVLSLVPLLYLAFSVLTYVIDQSTAMTLIETTIKEQLGLGNVDSLMEIVENSGFKKNSLTMNIIGGLVLLYSSSALLNSFRFSINEFYDIENPIKNRRKKIEYQIGSKLASIFYLPIFGIFLVVFYFGQSFILSLFHHFLDSKYPFQNFILEITSLILLILLNTLSFAMIFKYLNDGKVKKRVAFTGGFLTAVLFLIGQLGINYYINNLFFGSKGGVAGTILVVLIWMYYTSQIIFFGAKFTKIYAIHIGSPIVFKPRRITFRKIILAFKNIFTKED